MTMTTIAARNKSSLDEDSDTATASATGQKENRLFVVSDGTSSSSSSSSSSCCACNVRYTCNSCRRRHHRLRNSSSSKRDINYQGARSLVGIIFRRDNNKTKKIRKRRQPLAGHCNNNNNNSETIVKSSSIKSKTTNNRHQNDNNVFSSPANRNKKEAATVVASNNSNNLLPTIRKGEDSNRTNTTSLFSSWSAGCYSPRTPNTRTPFAKITAIHNSTPYPITAMPTTTAISRILSGENARYHPRHGSSSAPTTAENFLRQPEERRRDLFYSNDDDEKKKTKGVNFDETNVEGTSKTHRREGGEDGNDDYDNSDDEDDQEVKEWAAKLAPTLEQAEAAFARLFPDDNILQKTPFKKKEVDGDSKNENDAGGSDDDDRNQISKKQVCFLSPTTATNTKRKIMNTPLLSPIADSDEVVKEWAAKMAPALEQAEALLARSFLSDDDSLQKTPFKNNEGGDDIKHERDKDETSNQDPSKHQKVYKGLLSPTTATKAKRKTIDMSFLSPIADAACASKNYGNGNGNYHYQQEQEFTMDLIDDDDDGLLHEVQSLEIFSPALHVELERQQKLKQSRRRQENRKNNNRRSKDFNY